MWNKLNLFI